MPEGLCRHGRRDTCADGRSPERSIPEWALAVLAVLTFALIPIQINTIYSGLPAHPLFLHVPVILIPVAAIGAIVLVIWPRLFARHGICGSAWSPWWRSAPPT